MTSPLKSFLTELAALMEQYNIDIDATDHDKAYACYCDGIEFTCGGLNGSDFQVIKLRKSLDHDDITNALEDME